MVVNTAVPKWVLCNLDISKYLKILNGCSIFLKYNGSQTKKQNIIVTTDKELLGLASNIKKTTYSCIYTACAKSASKNSSDCHI